MEIIAILISIITLCAVGFMLFKLNQPISAPQTDKAVELIQKQMEEIRGSINRLYPDLTNTLQNVDKNTNARLDNAAKAIKDVYGRLGEVQESTKQVNEVAKDIASLQEILRAPKMRGGMGELFLSDLLKQVLPTSRYELQHRFKSREVVDAVIILKEGMVPVDSKFPLENFQKVMQAEGDSQKLAAKKQFVRDVKKHIDAIRTKYILPDEGTFDFALMYIPAENVYYEIVINDENLDEDKSVFRYAIDHKVIPVSPNSFYGYLQTILLGLRGMRIEERAAQILQDLARLEGDFTRVMDDFNKMGTHVKNMTNSYDATEKRLSKFGDKLDSLETKPEPLKIT
ncbi:MAG: DNA recombination protein RmuC [Candidatus Margulisbacteria bacterium]|nr:DNA recombination protein RmuC [Candidatus Margulisiibacteriota bacterium]